MANEYRVHAVYREVRHTGESNAPVRVYGAYREVRRSQAHIAAAGRRRQMIVT